MFCDYYSLVVCIYIFSCSFSFILNTKFVKKRPIIYFFLSAWENFWRHNGFPKRHSGAKAPLLLTLLDTDTADSSGSLGWVRFVQTEPELSGQVNPMIKGFVNIRRKFAFRNHNSSAALRRQSSSHRQVTSQFLNFKFFLLVCVWNDVSKWIVEIPTTRKIFLNNCYIKTFLWIDCVALIFELFRPSEIFTEVRRFQIKHIFNGIIFIFFRRFQIERIHQHL